MAINSSNASLTSTNGGGGGGGGSSLNPGQVTVEAYSVVLSVAALILAVVLGGGGSLSVLLAIFHSRRVRKYSYTLVLVFFFLCCGLDLVWAPMELAHLLTYHHARHNPTLDFGVATFTVYVFLAAGLAILIAAFCAENVLRGSGCFSSVVRHAWPVSVCVAMFLTSLLMAVSFLYASLGGLQGGSYLVLSAQSSNSRLSILTVLVLLVVLGAGGVVGARLLQVRQGDVKTSESFLSGQSNNGSSGPVPHFLVNQQDTAQSSEDIDKASISPCSSKLPDIIGPDVTPTTPIKGNNHAKRLGELPTPVQRTPNMLGVNMSQVLGRRRHTICQIGDSSTPPDPISKAKQYNYVRKFSVDISALQAQLENPKLFKDTAPFTSDQDIRQRDKDKDTDRVKVAEARGPLLPLPASVGAKMEAGGGGGAGVGELGGLKLSLPSRPPVITVSEEVKEDVEGEIKEEEEEEEEEEEDEEEEEEEEEEKVNCTSNPSRQEYMPIMNKSDLTDIPRLPISQPVDEEDEEEEEEEEEEEKVEEESMKHPCRGGEEDASFKSVSNDNRLSESDLDFVKMTLLMTLTFFLCTFPLFLVEALRGGISLHSYVNVVTCARALSSIQTIIYPHIVTCMDHVVNKAVARLKAKVNRICSLRDADCMDVPPDQASSSTSQV